MTRKLLLLPALAAALLAGCATYGYGQGGRGAGDYYYGQPEANDGYYGSYGYGYPGYYGYGAPYWGSSIGYYRYYVPSRHWHGDGHHHGGGHDGGDHGSGDHHNPPPAQDGPDRPRPPWRDLGGIDRPKGVRRVAEVPQARVEQARVEQARVEQARVEQARVEQAPPRMAPRREAPVQRAPDVPRVGGWKRDARRTPVR